MISNVWLLWLVVPGTACQAAGANGPDGQGDMPAVATVRVSPDSVNLQVGESAQFTAVVEDENGRTIPGATVVWSTTDASVATVDESGVVTAQASGTVAVTATSAGVSGSAVVAALAPPAVAGECAAPAADWVWCDDFEIDRLSAYFEYDRAGGNFERAAGVGVDGSTAMRARFTQGSTGAGALHLAIGRTPSSYFAPADAGTADYRELYWRHYLKLEPGWTGGGGHKLSRAFIFAESNWAQAMIAHLWAGSDPDSFYLFIDPVSGTDTQGNVVTTEYNDFPNFEWLGARRGDTPLFADAGAGRWYCIEAHVKLNDSGQNNGVFEFWIDGARDAARTDLNFVDSYDGYGLNAVYLENFWNGGAPRSQERYFDNFVVSTQRIGC